MASFPGSVKTYTSRNAGDVIQPSHVNEVQEEITALEDGLRNGTAPLNSSNSTFASVTVTGSFYGGVVGSARVNHSAIQQIPANTWTGLSWDTEEYDSTGVHSTAANSSRFTFGASTGVYHVGATVSMSGDTGAYQFVSIVSNDTNFLAIQGAPVGPAAGVVVRLTVAADIRVADLTDYVTIRVHSQGSTGRVNAHDVASGFPVAFWAHRVSA